MAHWHLAVRFLIVAVLAASSMLAVIADDSAQSAESERFAARKKALEDEKRSNNRSAILAYLKQMKHLIERDWHALDHTGLLITKVKIVIDSKGKISSSVIGPSSSKKEDKSIAGFLTGISFEPAPAGLDSIQLYLTFTSDGSLNAVDFSDMKEANDYYSELLGAPLLPTGTTGGIDFGPFMADLQRRIRRCWFPPKGNESKRVVVQFKVHKNGDISNLRIDHSSGLAIADHAALDAVNHAAPVRPLPAGTPENVDIQFTFDWNVFGGGDHGTFIAPF